LPISDATKYNLAGAQTSGIRGERKLAASGVINGKLPDKDYFKIQIAEAKAHRVVTIKHLTNVSLWDSYI